jgi:hypothetical protein
MFDTLLYINNNNNNNNNMLTYRNKIECLGGVTCMMFVGCYPVLLVANGYGCIHVIYLFDETYIHVSTLVNTHRPSYTTVPSPTTSTTKPATSTSFSVPLPSSPPRLSSALSKLAPHSSAVKKTKHVSYSHTNPKRASVSSGRPSTTPSTNNKHSSANNNSDDTSSVSKVEQACVTEMSIDFAGGILYTIDEHSYIKAWDIRSAILQPCHTIYEK